MGSVPSRSVFSVARVFLSAREEAGFPGEAQTGGRLRACLINKPSGCLLASPRVHPPAFGLLFSFTTQRERPSPSPEDGRKLTHQQDPSGLLDIWKDSQFFHVTRVPLALIFCFFFSLFQLFFFFCHVFHFLMPPHPTLSPALSFILSKHHLQEISEQSRPIESLA